MSLIETLANPAIDEDAKIGALGELSDVAADCYGADAANLGANIRAAGLIELLVEWMSASAIDVQQCAMSLLGNLLTDVFDPECDEEESLDDVTLNLRLRVVGIEVVLLDDNLGMHLPVVKTNIGLQ